MFPNKNIEELYNLYSKLVKFSNISWWLMDLEDNPNVFYCNTTMCKTFDLNPNLIKHSVSQTCPIAGDYNANVEMKSSHHAKLIFEDYQKLCTGEIKEYNNTFPYYRSDQNKTYYFTSRASVLEYDDCGKACVLFGIIEPENHNAELYKKATTDSLTGLSNRREFDSNLKFLIKLASEEQHPLSLIMLDIDNFKHYNDSQGHFAGDQCLIKISHIISKTCFHTSYTPYRYGGEEFAVIVYGHEHEALRIAERIRTDIEQEQINNPGVNNEPVTISTGIYSFLPNNNSKNREVIEKADSALYQAKYLGKNQTILFRDKQTQANLLA